MLHSADLMKGKVSLVKEFHGNRGENKILFTIFFVPVRGNRAEVFTNFFQKKSVNRMCLHMSAFEVKISRVGLDNGFDM